MRQVPREKIKIIVTPLPEYDTPEEAGKDSPGYAKAVREIQEKHGDDWNWCTAEVIATVPDLGICGVKTLGHCCYINEQDFIKNSGYYEDMVMEAIAELHDELGKHVNNLREAGIFDDHFEIAAELESLADGEDDDLGHLLTRAAGALRLLYNGEPVTK